MKIWNQNLDKFPKTTRELKRAFIDEGVRCGWPVKWGNQYGICYPDGRMVDTGLSTISSQTLREWVNFAKKNEEVL